MKYFTGLIFLFSLNAMADAVRIPNKCWNVALEGDELTLCREVCLPSVNAIVKDLESSPCASEQKAVDKCLADFGNCLDAYQGILNKRDNCETRLVNACFDNLK